MFLGRKVSTDGIFLQPSCLMLSVLVLLNDRARQKSEGRVENRLHDGRMEPEQQLLRLDQLPELPELSEQEVQPLPRRVHKKHDTVESCGELLLQSTVITIV